MTGQNVQDWLNELDNVDPLSVEVEVASYPWVQWVNGSAKQKAAGGVLYHGGWFEKVREVRQGWQPGELIHEDGSLDEGLFRRDLTVAIIAVRRRWITRGAGPQQGFPWSDYQKALEVGAVSGHMQALVLIQGEEGLGPVVLTAKGTVAHEFLGSAKNPNGVIALFRSRIVGAANDLAHKAGKSGLWPLRAFWLNVGPQRDDKGNPTFTVVGKAPNTSTVIFPTLLGTHDKMTPDEIRALFVGKELLTDLNRMYDETAAWRTAWDAPSAPKLDLGPGVEPPQEDDVPF
jgi:hypothetical protein